MSAATYWKCSATELSCHWQFAYLSQCSAGEIYQKAFSEEVVSVCGLSKKQPPAVDLSAHPSSWLRCQPPLLLFYQRTSRQPLTTTTVCDRRRCRRPSVARCDRVSELCVSVTMRPSPVTIARHHRHCPLVAINQCVCLLKPDYCILYSCS